MSQDDEHLEKILQLQEISGLNDMADCRNLLTRYNWNIEDAVNNMFNDSENVQNDAIVANVSTPFNYVNNENSDHSMLELIQRIFRLSTPIQDYAPQSVSGNRWMEWIYKLFTLPIRFVYYTIIAFYHFFTSMLPTSSSNRRLTYNEPEREMTNFIKKFELEYGPIHPTFYQSSYSKALRDSKAGAKYLLVYLHDFQSENCRLFCRDILCTRTLTTYFELMDDWIIWVCDMDSYEGQKIINSSSIMHGDLDRYSAHASNYSSDLSHSTPYRLNNARSRHYGYNPKDPNAMPLILVFALKFPTDPYLLDDEQYPEDLSQFINSYFRRGHDSANANSNNLNSLHSRDPSKLKMSLVFRIKGIDTLKLPPSHSSSNQDVSTSSSSHSALSPERTLLDVQSFITKLQTAVHQNSEGVALAKEDKNRRESTLSLRKQQEEALKQSLEADKLKTQVKREERLATERKQLDAKFLHAKKKHINIAIQELKKIVHDRLTRSQAQFDYPQGLSPTTPNGLVKVIVKLPNGKRLEKPFASDAPLQELYDYVFCNIGNTATTEESVKSNLHSPKSIADPDNSHSNHDSLSYTHFKLTTHYPRQILPCDLCATDKDFLLEKVKEGLLEENPKFQEILLEELSNCPNFEDEFDWLFLDGSPPNSRNPIKNSSSSNLTSNANLTFQDIGLTQTTVVYVQDV